MRQNNVISERDYTLAVNAPLTVTNAGSTSVEAPYFVDMVNDALQSMFTDTTDFQSNAYRIYTTIDMRLQRAAGEAIRAGMASVDEQIKKQKRFKGQTPPAPQVALVAIDPHTGEVKAFAGGRNYGMSQLNHALASRQPGSIFKPFVYATALETGINGSSKVLTGSTMIVDEPTTFYYDTQPPYTPGNFDKKFMGPVTLRDALAHSLNVATVKVAEMVGYGAVVNMANRAGMNYKVQPTPSVALGAYEITPLEAAGAYTMFANRGDFIKPSFLSLVRSQGGKIVYRNKVDEKQVLDPRVAYLTTSLMEEVLRSGTAAGVRARFGFTVPAAGKTGTSHDGWFAGYTSELLCVVWVGFDDNRELNLEGAHSAAPIWAQFMKKALDYREYRDVKSFRAPEGILSVEIDPESGMRATPQCPKRRNEVYIAGTEPVEMCPLHGGRGTDPTVITGWDSTPTPTPAPRGGGITVTGSQGDGQTPSDPAARRAARQGAGQAGTQPAPAAPPPGTPPKQDGKKPEKKGILQRLIGVFK